MSESGTINKIILIGEISRPPRWHKSNDGRQVLCFMLITREGHRQNGFYVEHTEEHYIRIPEHKLDHDLETGQMICVEGKIQTIAYTDDQQVKRYKTQIFALKIGPIGRASDYPGQRAPAA